MNEADRHAAPAQEVRVLEPARVGALRSRPSGCLSGKLFRARAARGHAAIARCAVARRTVVAHHTAEGKEDGIGDRAGGDEDQPATAYDVGDKHPGNAISV